MPTVTETIVARLEASRKDLLDLGLRNPLLNYKATKGRGLQIVQERSPAIFDILVRQNKAMTFLGRPSKNDAPEEIELPELTEEELEDAYNDTKLQTNETDKQLQVKILNTYYFAKTSIEEQGINILYLALGMLSWYEEGNKDDKRFAPLLLIPVSLERSSAQERFRLRYTGSEIGTNLSLQAKMLAEFSITIPDIADPEELDVSAYFAGIEERINHQTTWSVERDNIQLGFFSFGKFMIYHDLDSNKWPDSNKPFDNAAIISLFGDGFKEQQPTYTEEHHLDNQTEAENLFQVVDADSSQVLAMLAVNEGRNMVIQGPPGTGKSQTITNLIANAIGQGKKVLFVAEKLAALEVVKRRLDNIHLGEACLELHSHKANKKTLHEELKRILDLGKPTLTSLEREILLLEQYRDSLNAYCEAINQHIKQSGLSAQKVIGYLLQVAEDCKDFTLRKIMVPGIERWNEEIMKRAEATADTIQATLQNINIPTELLFWGTGLKVLLPHEKETLAGALVSTQNNLTNLVNAANAAATQTGMPSPDTIASITQLITMAKLASQSPGLIGINVKDAGWWQQKDDLDDLLSMGRRLSELHAAYDHQLMAEAWQQDVLEIRQNLQVHGHKWYKFLIGAYNKSDKKLAGLCTGTPVKTLVDKLQLVDAIAEAKRLEKDLATLETVGIALFGAQWRKQRSDWDYLVKVEGYLSQVHENIIAKKYPSALLNYLQQQTDVSVAEGIASWLHNHVTHYQQSAMQLLALLQFDEKERFKEKAFIDQPLAMQQEIINAWQDRLPEIFLAIQWNNLTDNVATTGFDFLLKQALDWPEAKRLLKTGLQKSWYEYLLEQAMAQPALRQFERAGHEEAIEKFKALDVVNLQYNRARVALKHWQTVPRQEAGGQVNILKSEFNRRARHMAIRRLIQEAGLAIQAIKPVFMMSPMSIANFLAPGSIEFDLVIFDEASQVRPVDALGALLRAKQLVVVGDTRQLPPTSFFDKMNTDTEDEDNVTADMQSILGMCNGQGVPERMLRWHYRSRHESLISLSNHEFYENRLVIFPSAGSRERLGLVYHHLPQTVYDSGKTRTNQKEAEAVADAVMEHAARNPKQTLGVIAFSTTQMQAIQFALEIRRRKRPELENFFRSHPHEPFVVKNLENVQGDERDVIFISIGYGRTEEGKVPQRFGPLNNNGGERRLNVLITRAKYRCEVFTNMTSDDIAVTPLSKLGIRSLKSFLYFAQHGKFDSTDDTEVPIQTPFEDYITRRLTAKGYTVRQKVGMEGVYIDLAVVDEEHPGRYLLGIDCDGNAYANAKSARDRDRLRRQVLELIGWNMSRAWSLDWLYHPDAELARLIAVIEKVKEQIKQGDVEREIYENEIADLVREQVTETVSVIPMYACAELSADISSQEFHLHPLGKLSGWLQEVVRVESPVHFEEVAVRLTRAAGVSKVGSRIRDGLVQATKYAEQAGKIKIQGDFLWHKDMEIPVIRDRSSLPSASKKLQYISPEELAQAVRKVVEESIAIQPESAMPIIFKMLGFARITEEMRKDLLPAISFAVEKGMVKKDGEWLKGVNN